MITFLILDSVTDKLSTISDAIDLRLSTMTTTVYYKMQAL